MNVSISIRHYITIITHEKSKLAKFGMLCLYEYYRGLYVCMSAVFVMQHFFISVNTCAHYHNSRNELKMSFVL